MGRRSDQQRTNSTTSQGYHQHFSHHHNLVLVSLSQGQTLPCNACDQQNNTTNNPIYGCNTCQYYLHENCLNAPRFLDHPAHPSHPLSLHSIPSYPTCSYTCKACNTNGNGFSFSCARCEFDIHLQCASCPNSIFVADDKHPHQLQLFYESPYENKSTVYTCDVCNVTMSKDTWLYYCAHCDFGSHLHCAMSPEVGVFPKQNNSIPSSNPNPSPNPNRSSNPNPSPNPNPRVNPSVNPTVEMINSVNEAHEQLVATQIRLMIEARGREAALDLI